MINKNLVHKRFAKNLHNYDENAKIQKRMAERLVAYIANNQPKSILEIGCGTGFLTKLIVEKCEFMNYKAIDIVEDCNEFIEKISKTITFIPIDIEKYLKVEDEKFDLIISNASLQWVEDFENTVNTLRERLNPDGELIFSTFGNENFREIYHVMGTTLKYYSITELSKMFPKSLIEQEIHILAFETPKEVLRHLQLTGVNGIENASWTKKDLTRFEFGYKNLCNRRPTLTYNPIYIKMVK